MRTLRWLALALLAAARLGTTGCGGGGGAAADAGTDAGTDADTDVDGGAFKEEVFDKGSGGFKYVEPCRSYYLVEMLDECVFPGWYFYDSVDPETLGHMTDHQAGSVNYIDVVDSGIECDGGADSDTDSDSDTDTDSDSDSDTGTDTDSDSDADTDLDGGTGPGAESDDGACGCRTAGRSSGPARSLLAGLL